jgi:hypothetical protein
MQCFQSAEGSNSPAFMGAWAKDKGLIGIRSYESPFANEFDSLLVYLLMDTIGSSLLEDQLVVALGHLSKWKYPG